MGGISKTRQRVGLVRDGAPSESHCRRWSWRELGRRAARDCRFLSSSEVCTWGCTVVSSVYLLATSLVLRARLAVYQALCLVHCTTDHVGGRGTIVRALIVCSLAVPTGRVERETHKRLAPCGLGSFGRSVWIGTHILKIAVSHTPTTKTERNGAR